MNEIEAWEHLDGVLEESIVCNVNATHIRGTGESRDDGSYLIFEVAPIDPDQLKIWIEKHMKDGLIERKDGEGNRITLQKIMGKDINRVIDAYEFEPKYTVFDCHGNIDMYPLDPDDDDVFYLIDDDDLYTYYGVNDDGKFTALPCQFFYRFENNGNLFVYNGDIL